MKSTGKIFQDKLAAPSPNDDRLPRSGRIPLGRVQAETDEEKRLRAGCARVLTSLACVEKELRTASGGSTPSG